MDTRPIANKYREGKMQSTLKRESNEDVKALQTKLMEKRVQWGLGIWGVRDVKVAGLSQDHQVSLLQCA